MKKITFIFSLFLLIFPVLRAQGDGMDIGTDSLALVAFYNECAGETPSGFDGWLTADSLKNWQNVTVDSIDGALRVTHVEFKNMTLTGSLPKELGDLTEMSGKIQMNDKPALTGTFPAFIWNWTKVDKMQIKNCGFTAIDVTGIENMVNLIEINTQGTPFVGEVPVAIFNLPLLSKIYLEDGMWSSLPANMPIPTPSPLTRFYINGNQFTDLPDLSAMIWGSSAKVKIYDNFLTFEDIEPNMPLATTTSFTYSPQGTIGEDRYVYAAAGSPVTLSSNIGGSAATVYSWIAEEEEVADTKDLSFASFDPATQSGTYFCQGQNTNVSTLVLTTGMIKLYESATAQDSLALVALYNECGGADWTGFDHWMNGPLSTWEGLTLAWVKNEAKTDSALRVTNVAFKNMTLTGTLPDALANLTEMSGKIELLDQPGLTGEFPAAIWNWTKVERMQIKRCGFTSMDVTGIEKMVNLYEINTESTPFVGEVPVAIFNLPLMAKIYLEKGMWSSLPADMPATTPTPLTRFYINGNQFTDLPDLSGMVWGSGAKVKMADNYLSFDDIKPNMALATATTFTYSPQSVMGDDAYVYATAGSPVTLESNIGGTATTVYSWIKGEEEAADTKDLMLSAYAPSTESGTYFCIVQDTEIDGLVITTKKTMLFESATAQDSLALVALYTECGGADWSGASNWLNGPLSTWEKLTLAEVDGAMRVTNIAFKYLTLTGTLPDALGNLTEMAGKIELSEQAGLTGEFPAAIWNWTKVERLQIKRCGFTSMDVTGIEKMVNLYEINTQATPFAGEVPAAIFNLPLMRDVYLEDGMWTGLAADMPIPTPTPLRRFYINGNQFTSLPDLTGMVWAEGTKIKIRNNSLRFEDVEPNMWIADDANVSAFEYSPQQAYVSEDMYVYSPAGSATTLQSNIAGTESTIYSWLKGDDEVATTADLTLASFDPATESGSYFCIAQSSKVPGLQLMTGKKMLFESATAQDSLALVALYNACGGSAWTGVDHWMTDSLASWEKITVTEIDGVERVTNIAFKSMTLTGTFPAELAYLSEMTGKIEILDQAGLTGEFPAVVWNWTKVERMQIKRCGFTSMDVTGIENMVNLYEINTEATPFAGEVPAAIFNLPLMAKVYLENGMWSSLPSDMPTTTPTPLTRFYINGNQFTDLPNLTGMVFGSGAKVKIANNFLTFEDLEPNVWIASDANVDAFEFSPQAFLTDKDTSDLVAGDALDLAVSCGGTANVYIWTKDGELIDGAESETFQIATTVKDDAGVYQCIVQNTLVPGLDLMSDTFTVVVTNPASLGSVNELTLKVNGNPVSDVLSIDSKDIIEFVTISDITGAIVRQESIDNTNLRISVSDLKEGIYFVSLKGQAGASVVRIIKK